MECWCSSTYQRHQPKAFRKKQKRHTVWISERNMDMLWHNITPLHTNPAYITYISISVHIMGLECEWEDITLHWKGCKYAMFKTTCIARISSHLTYLQHCSAHVMSGFRHDGTLCSPNFAEANLFSSFPSIKFSHLSSVRQTRDKNL